MKKIKELFSTLMYKLGYIKLKSIRVDIKEVHYNVEIVKYQFRIRKEWDESDEIFQDKLAYTIKRAKGNLMEKILDHIEVKREGGTYDELVYELRFPLMVKK